MFTSAHLVLISPRLQSLVSSGGGAFTFVPFESFKLFLSNQIHPPPPKLLLLRISINRSRSKGLRWTSLVVPWLRIHLPMQGTQVQSLGTQIPHATGKLSLCSPTTEPSPYNPCSATRETTSLRSLCARKLESSPCSSPRKPKSRNTDPVQPTIE